MRRDVKLGVAISSVLITATGGYFVFRDGGEVAIPMSAAGSAAKVETKNDVPPEKPAVGNPADQTRAGRSKPQPTDAQKGAGERKASNTAPVPTSGAASNQGSKVPERNPVPVSDTRLANQTPVRSSSAPTNPSTGGLPKTEPSAAATQLPVGSNVSTGTPATQGPARPAAQPITPIQPSDVVGPPAPERLAVAPNPATAGGAQPSTGEPQPRTVSPLTSSRVPNNAPNTGDRNIAANSQTGGAIRSNEPPAASLVNALTGQPLPQGKNPANALSAKSVEPTVTDASASKAATDTHRVQSGDTLASLSQSYYGSEKFTRLLQTSNPQIRDPHRLTIGMVLKIPPAPDVTASVQPTASGTSSVNVKGSARTYHVQSGDTFYSIAKSVLGDATRWKELLALNREVVNGDATQLQIGQMLKLPER